MNHICIVLVNTKYPRNIGLVSRAMSNFGLERLILISPRCELSLKARQGAAEGQGPLSQAIIYNHWEEFYGHEKEGLRIAFSRRQGRRRKSEALSQLVLGPHFNFHQPLYLIFGSEDKGLSAEDLTLVHQLAYLDLPGPVQSMNLSHAVVACLQIINLQFKSINQAIETSDEPIVDPEPFLRDWLTALQFDLTTHTRWNALVMLKQWLLRAQPSHVEMDQLKNIIHQTLRRLK